MLLLPWIVLKCLLFCVGCSWFFWWELCCDCLIDRCFVLLFRCLKNDGNHVNSFDDNDVCVRTNTDMMGEQTNEPLNTPRNGVTTCSMASMVVTNKEISLGNIFSDQSAPPQHSEVPVEVLDLHNNLSRKYEYKVPQNHSTNNTPIPPHRGTNNNNSIKGNNTSTMTTQHHG